MTFRSALAALSVVAVLAVPAFSELAPKPLPVVYELRLIRMSDTERPQYIFAVGASGFSSVESLKRFVPRLPKGSTLRWDPGCKRMGDEPLLSSQNELTTFAELCKKSGIKFELVPSG